MNSAGLSCTDIHCAISQTSACAGHLRTLVNGGSTLVEEPHVKSWHRDGEDAAVDLRSLKRADIVVALAVVAASIVIAIAIQLPVTNCSYIGSVPPRGCFTTNYSMTFRLGIVGVGLVVAGLIVAVRWYMRRHRSQAPRQGYSR